MTKETDILQKYYQKWKKGKYKSCKSPFDNPFILHGDEGFTVKTSHNQDFIGKTHTNTKYIGCVSELASVYGETPDKTIDEFLSGVKKKSQNHD